MPKSTAEMPWSYSQHYRHGRDWASPQATIGTVREANEWYWSIVSWLMSEEEFLDYFYTLKEATNAYSKELTWTLAIVLCCTCLYIYRALGQQEAARVHSQMVNSRPVFSTMPRTQITSDYTNSSFLTAYKNRFAHKDTKTQVPEKATTVGYDVLHRDFLVPRAMWKRHSMGTDRLHLQTDLWDTDTSTCGSSLIIPKRSPLITGLDFPPLYAARIPVPLQRSTQHRSITADSRQLQQQNVHQHQTRRGGSPTIKQHIPPQKPHVCEPVRPPRGAESPLGHPVPPPRSESVQRGKEVCPIALPRTSPTRTEGQDSKGRRQGKPLEYSSSGTDSSESSDSSNYRTIKPRDFKKKKPTVKPGKGDSQQKKKKDEGPVGNVPNKADIKLNTEQKHSTNTTSSPTKDPRSNNQFGSQVQLEMLDRIRNNLQSEDSTERFQAASSFLEQFSQVFADGQQKSENVSKQNVEKGKRDTLELDLQERQLHTSPRTHSQGSMATVVEQPDDKPTSIMANKPTSNSADTTPKRSIRVSQAALRSDSSNRIPLNLPGVTKKTEFEKYDSAVLRAVKAEEESLKSEKETDSIHHCPTYTEHGELVRNVSSDFEEGASGKGYSRQQESEESHEENSEENLAMIEQLIADSQEKDDEIDSLVASNMCAGMDDRELDNFGVDDSTEISDAGSPTHEPKHDNSTTTNSFSPASDVTFISADRVDSFLEIPRGTCRATMSASSVSQNGLSQHQVWRTSSLPSSKGSVSNAQASPSEMKPCPAIPSVESSMSDLKTNSKMENTFMSWKEKLSNESTLDEIIEHQQKRREHLKKSRNKTPQAFNVDTLTKSADALLPSQDLAYCKQQALGKNETATTQRNTGRPQLSDIKPTENKGHYSVNSFQNALKLRENGDSVHNNEQLKRREQRVTTCGGKPFLIVQNKSPTPYAPPANVNYEEQGTARAPQHPTDSKSTLGLERESPLRRRIRWRRLVERAERQNPEMEHYVERPPVPPKAAYLSDISLGPDSLTENGIPKSSPRDPHSVDSFFDDRWAQNRSTGPIPGCNVAGMAASHDAALAAGETGLADRFKVHPETGIYVEKSLTPSKAASIFDPKAVREREIEKQEAERAVRENDRRSVSSPDFKANIRKFETAAALAAAEVENLKNAKSNVRTYANVSRGMRSMSLSPERRGSHTARVSRVSPGPSPGSFSPNQILVSTSPRISPVRNPSPMPLFS